jgi:diguanylate cyclase (GGDEF)-like protein
MVDGKTARRELLLIEDDESFSENLKRRLQRESHGPLEVRQAATLRQALKILSEKNFHIILLDINLPDSKGIETYVKVQGFSRGAPIVILTGWDDNELAMEAVRRGAEDYLIKNEVEGKFISRVLLHAMERSRIKRELGLLSRRLRESNLRLEKMTILDPLTELLNRRGFQQALTREVQWSRRHQTDLLAMLIDIDHFKESNDVLGYAVGDILLREVANTLRKTVRMTDHLARIGGDEFIILMPETTSEDGVTIAERIRMAIIEAAFLVLKNKKMKVSVSGSLVKVAGTLYSTDELLAKLHPLLKKSKRAGGNKVSYEGECLGEIENAPGLVLNRGLDAMRDGRNFFAVKQPIYRLSDREIVGYEFLARLKTEDFTMPEDFFRIAVENNMVPVVDRHCFRACVREAGRVAPHLRCHLNVFPSTLVDASVHELIGILAKDYFARGRYCFELSEQQILGGPFYLEEAVQAIKDAGILLAVDDVGFGYTCLESLVCFEPDVIKLDRSCLRRSSDERKKIKVLEHLVKIFDGLKAEIIAEGVESEADLQTLREVNVHYGQGYFWGEPG